MENEESKLFVRKILEEYIGEDGRVHVRSEWVLCNTEFNLGSFAKPNKETISFKYEIPQANPFENMFGGLFGGRK